MPAVAAKLQPISIEKLFRGRSQRGTFRSASMTENSDGTYTVGCVITTETPYLRQVSPWDYLCGPDGQEITEYEEILLCNESAVDRTYLDQGMSICDSHNDMLVRNNVYGEVIPDSIGYEVIDGVNAMVAKLRLNEIAEALNIVAGVKNGTIKFLSPAYDYVKAAWRMIEGQIPQLVVEGWMPTELSFVAVPADVKAQIRSKFSTMLRSRTKEFPMTKPAATTEPAVPTEAEIAAAQAIVDAAAVRAKAAATPAVIVPPVVPAAPAARSVIPADNAEVAQLLTASRTLNVFEAVEAARLTGATLEEMRDECSRARRSRPAPVINTDLTPKIDATGQVIPGTGGNAKARSFSDFSGYAILKDIEEREAKTGKRFR